MRSRRLRSSVTRSTPWLTERVELSTRCVRCLKLPQPNESSRNQAYRQRHRPCKVFLRNRPLWIGCLRARKRPTLSHRWRRRLRARTLLRNRLLQLTSRRCRPRLPKHALSRARRQLGRSQCSIRHSLQVGSRGQRIRFPVGRRLRFRSYRRRSQVPAYPGTRAGDKLWRRNSASSLHRPQSRSRRQVRLRARQSHHPARTRHRVRRATWQPSSAVRSRARPRIRPRQSRPAQSRKIAASRQREPSPHRLRRASASGTHRISRHSATGGRC